MLVSQIFGGIFLFNVVGCLQAQNFARFEAVNAPNGWETVGSPPKDHKLRLSVFLKAAS
jgi:hypothetical protein